MRGGKWIAVAVAVGSISTGVAVATGGSSETSQVMGTFELTPGKAKQRQCAPHHDRVDVRFKGTQQSDDERLAGNLEVKAESVINTDPDNRWGRSEGSVKIRGDGRHGKTKFSGEFIAVLEPDGGVEGFITGETKDGAHLFANFNADQNPDGTLHGEFGTDTQTDKPYAPDEDQDPAILTNACFKGHGHGGHGH
jgi:hypothetical protein